MAKEMLSFRVRPEIKSMVESKARELVESQEFRNRNEILEHLIEAWVSGRLLERPEGPDAFPAEAIPAGTRQSHPILFAFSGETDGT